jgi:hypothetical protein
MTYVPALPPRQHQKEALQRMGRIHKNFDDVFALLMDMGTGKSKVICDEFGARVEANDASDLIVIAPAGCYGNWIDDHPEDPSEFHKQLAPALFERLHAGKWKSGAGVRHTAALKALVADTDRPRALVINAEALARIEKAENLVREFIQSSKRGVIIAVDESPLMKNFEAIRTGVITSLAFEDNVIARRILSGLVAPNSPLDLFSQFYFLDWRILGFRSFVGFRARYAVMQEMTVGLKQQDGELVDRTIHVPVGFRHYDELYAKIEPFSFRVLKDECLDLPKKQYVSRDVNLTDEQARIYRELLLHATAELAAKRFVSVDMVLTQRLRLSQVLCGFTMDEEGHLAEIPERRTHVMLETIQQYQGKVIIWSYHDYVIQKVAKILRREYGRKSVSQFWGGNRTTRGDEEHAFKTDPERRFMVASPPSGGRGNNWPMAGLAIYYDNSDNLDHRAQSEDRNHREGLMGPTGAGSALYCDLIARGTIDEKKVKNLRNKINISSIIQGDDYKEWLI